MSSHGLAAKARGPNPKAYQRRAFQVAHVLFEVADHPENGCTFALLVGDPVTAADRRPLFSGHIEPGMGTQLRRLAHHIDDLEAKMARQAVSKNRRGQR